MTEEEKKETEKPQQTEKAPQRTREEKIKNAYKTVNETLLREHKFWSKEPLGKKQNEIKDTTENKSLPEEIEIRTVDIVKDIHKVASLLINHYVEDPLAVFSLQYSTEFIKWQLNSPSVYRDWNVGLYDKESLIGFISAAAINIKIKESHPKTAVVNFLCVHKEYRKRRLSPVLIKEITKRVNKEGIYTALFTSGEKLPYIFTRSRYYHKILRSGQLIESGFCEEEHIQSMAHESLLSYSMPTVSYRKAREEDLPRIYEMYRKKYRTMDISADYTYDQFKYYTFTREGLCDLLISTEENEFVSVFYLSTKSAKTDILIKTAYLSYHNMQSGKESILGLTEYLQHQNKTDVLNALEIENNTEELLLSSGFARGDGVINYYLFNWETELIPPSRNSFIPS